MDAVAEHQSWPLAGMPARDLHFRKLRQTLPATERLQLGQTAFRKSLAGRVTTVDLFSAAG